MLRGLFFGVAAALTFAASAPAEAGSWTIRYSGGTAGGAPYQMDGDGNYGGHAMGSSCGGAITVSVAWTADYRGELPPAFVYLREDSRANAHGMGAVPPPPSSADNGIGSGTVRNDRVESGITYEDATSAGHRILYFPVPKGGRFQFTREPKAAGPVSTVRYKAEATEFVYQIVFEHDDTMRPSDTRDAMGRATPVASCDPFVVTPRRGDTVLNTEGGHYNTAVPQFLRFSAFCIEGSPIEPYHTWDAYTSGPILKGTEIVTSDHRHFEDSLLYEFDSIDYHYHYDRLSLEGMPLPFTSDKVRLHVKNRANYGPEEATAEYELRVHLPSENPVMVGSLGEDYTSLSVTYEDNELPIDNGESIGVRAFPGPWQAWWSGVNGIAGDAVSISSGLIKDPRWSLLMAAAGYGLSNVEADSMFVHASFETLWNSASNPYRNESPNGYEMFALVADCVRGVDLWRTDEYGVKGFIETVHRPVHNRTRRLEVEGAFRLRS